VNELAPEDAGQHTEEPASEACIEPPVGGPGILERALHATYRVQLTPAFGLEELRKQLPYFARVGISHVYLSPCLEAVSGSAHGHDVTDPTRVREELGGEAGWRAVLGVCRELGLGGDRGHRPRSRREQPGRAARRRRPGLRRDSRAAAVHAFHDRSAVPFLEQLSREVRALEQKVGRTQLLIAESDLNDPRLIRALEAGGLGLDAQWSDDFHHALRALLTVSAADMTPTSERSRT
jgi:hypothetical protein